MCSCLIFNSESCCPAGGLTNFERIISANVCVCVYVSAWACVFTVWCYKNRLVCSTSRSRQGEPINKINYKLSLYHIHTKIHKHTPWCSIILSTAPWWLCERQYSCKSPQRISVQRHMAAAQCSAPAIKDLMQVLLSVCYGVCACFWEKQPQQPEFYMYSEDNERGTCLCNTMPTEMPMLLSYQLNKMCW